MKKLNLALAAVAALTMASCSSDEPAMTATDGMTTFSVAIPASVQSRATFGDGTSIPTNIKLQYSVFQVENNDPSTLGTAVTSGTANGSFTADGTTSTPDTYSMDLSLNLAKGKTYQVVFWAADPSQKAYTWDAATTNLTVDYAAANQAYSNNEELDAYFGSVVVDAGAQNTQAILKRPFAQLNLMTSDLSDVFVTKAYPNGVNTSLAISTALPTEVNLFTGETGTSATATPGFTKVPASAQTTTIGTTTYTVLTMDYLLVGKTGVTAADCEWSFYDGASATSAAATLNVPAVPLQRNYQTNVYGALLTTPTSLQVTINPAFDGTAPGAWDGSTSKAPSQAQCDFTNKVISINTPEELKWLADASKNTSTPLYNNTIPQGFEGFAIKLNFDMNLGGHDLNIGEAGRLGSAILGGFKGVIDGQGHIVSNMTGSTPLIGGLVGESAALKNITFDNCAVTSKTGDAAVAVGYVGNGAKVSKVFVKASCSVTSGDAAGGVVARMIKSGSISNCQNAAAITSTKNNVGGIVGATYYSEQGKQMNIISCLNTGKISAGNVCAGGIAGLACANFDDCTNTGEISAVQNSTGGIAGGVVNGGSFNKCDNLGNVNGAGLGTGGIAGWVRYNGGTSAYPQGNVVTFTDCQNMGRIKSNGQGTNDYGVGGICGLLYYSATFNGCHNMAQELTGSKFVAGICGAEQNTETHDGFTDPQSVVIENCTSTTTLAQMNCTDPNLKALLIYINNPANVTLTNNTPAQN